MMEENDKWIKNLRDRMENHSAPVPTDLWSQLEGELEASPKVIPLWRRWQSVAAIALLVIVSSLGVWWVQSPTADYVKQYSAQLEEVLPADVAGSIRSEMPEGLVAQHLPTEPALAKAKREEMPQPIVEAPSEEASPEEEGMTKQEPEAEPQIEENYPEEQQTLTPAVKATQRGKGRSTRSASTYIYNKEKKQRHWSIGISTGNGGTATSVHTDGYLPLPSAVKGMYIINSSAGFTARSAKLAAYAYAPDAGKATSDVDYHLPVIFGASVRFDLDKDWAVESGITYTQLSSESTSGDRLNKFQWQEKLHYVGIPLKLHRRIWENKRFEVYALAGGAVEKCVSGEQTMMQRTTEGNTPVETDITVKPLQWSVSAAAGAQFKLTERLGIYAEPGIAYYFDDGSKLNTIRKEHPLNFHLQVGLRFSFSK